MSAPPYMKLFWGDYHKATRHLTRDQHGAYFLLIGEAWRLGGSLPDDDKLLAAWALCTPEEWAAMKPIITGFFALRRGKWTHDRVREELAHYESISRKRKSAGKAGGSASGGKHTENPQAIAEQKPTKPEPEPESKKEKNPTGALVLPFDAQDVGDKVAARRGSRLPADWRPSSADIAFAMREHNFTQAEAERIGDAFRDHWTAAPGAKGVKLDWSATWRNWIRTEAQRRAPRKAAATGRQDWV